MIKNHKHSGFTLLEFVPVLMIAVMLLIIVLFALNPAEWFAEARNTTRKHDISLIADAIIEYSRDNDLFLLYTIPTSPDSSQEICGDALTGSCTGLFDINRIVGTYMVSVPIDPKSKDGDSSNEHSRYFIIRNKQRFTISAVDAELDETIEVSR
ncbi:type II secretion system protein [Candidatus Peribacteria bacterium]|jgi:type II secretory pathway pseudopilin PulG|nr:type II secretion system protein [Candidatus Peribacteria bacterium]MBT4021716.1 type II secretion system protein [Candidatus Peribacteria bacterium]MBT4241179.1 type II secretion system protein [Candidatus Peribacteria bacterium]MBT4473932.1 type II secretion system protein [Candidatus Peribacteria bacterium]